jgi:hypothetical protein
MKSYVVMTSSETNEAVHFIKDGFSAFAFALPLVWLLWKKLWLEAALYFGLMGIIAALLLWSGLRDAAALSAILTIGLNAIVGLEGGVWVRRSLEQRGFQASDFIVAPNERSAVEMYASRMVSTSVPHGFRAVSDRFPTNIFLPLGAK